MSSTMQQYEAGCDSGEQATFAAAAANVRAHAEWVYAMKAKQSARDIIERTRCGLLDGSWTDRPAQTEMLETAQAGADREGFEHGEHSARRAIIRLVRDMPDSPPRASMTDLWRSLVTLAEQIEQLAS